MKIKWRIFIPLWIVVLLLAPSIWLPQAMYGANISPDGPGLAVVIPSVWLPQTLYDAKRSEDDPGRPAVIPFSLFYWAKQNGIFQADEEPDYVEYLGNILPTVIYTFPVSLGIYFLVSKLIGV